MQNDNLKNYLLLHLIVFIWGFTAVLGALINQEALTLVWYRMLLAVVFVVMFLVYKKINLNVTPKLLIKLIILGIIIALHWVTFFWSIKVSTVSVTLACMSTGAFFTSFLEPLFFRRKIISYEIFFGLIVIFGLWLIFETEYQYVHGILLALISAFLSALFSVINGKIVHQLNEVVISFHELLSGVIFLTVILLINGSFEASFFQISYADLGYLLLLSSVCTAYAFIVSVKILRYITPYTVMLTINLEPIYGIILALLFFGEKEMMSPLFYVGALIILATVILNGIWKLKSKRKLQSQNK